MTAEHATGPTNYNLKVVYKPGPEMYVSVTLSRATASGTHTHTHSIHEQHTVCSLQTEKVDVEHINQTDYLNVTDQRLTQIRQHTDRDEHFQALRYVILMG
jgi:hypothetical protein